MTISMICAISFIYTKPSTCLSIIDFINQLNEQKTNALYEMTKPQGPAEMGLGYPLVSMVISLELLAYN